MAGKPWAVVVTAAASALVAVGALAGAAMLRDRGATDDPAAPPSSVTASGAGVDGCLVEPCTVLDTVNVAGTTIELVVDSGGGSGRLRIGGAGSSEVIEVTITGMGAVLGPDSLQCVAGTQMACLLRGSYADGVVGQVVVGRSAEWGELAQPFQSDAGYLALTNVPPDDGAEILVAQHSCDRTETADCATTPVFVRVFDLRSQEKGCTRDYPRLESLPGWPTVTLTPSALEPCESPAGAR